jgi:hypothetical protein
VGEALSATSGTLGGLLHVEGVDYGVSCGHVIGADAATVQPSHPDDGSNQTIGTCRKSTASQLVGRGQRCQVGGNANTVDAALIEIDQTVPSSQAVRKLGAVVRTVPVAEVAEDEVLQVSARSGVRRLAVGALAVRRTIAIDGTDYCFKDLFELRRTGQNWGAKGSVSSPTEDGDSGAWVLRGEPGGYAWVGMVTAGDGPVGYAQFAETVEAWARSAVH